MNVRATSRRSERLDAHDAIAGACSSRSAGQAPRVAPELTPATRLRRCVGPANDVLDAKLASGISDLFSPLSSGLLLSQPANTNWENDGFNYEVASESSIARDYDPSVGRWVSKDPSRFRGGLNLYGYCYGDSINLLDMTGRGPQGAAVGAAAGGAIGGYLGFQWGVAGGAAATVETGPGIIGGAAAGGALGFGAGAGLGGFAFRNSWGTAPSK